MQQNASRYLCPDTLAFTFQVVNAGNNGFFRNNSVGGISINSDGVVSNVDLESRKLLLKEMHQTLKPAEGKMAAKTELRMVSLCGLEAAIADAVQNGQGALPDEVDFLPVSNEFNTSLSILNNGYCPGLSR